MAKVNILVENINETSDELKTVVLENVEVDLDKLMAYLTGKPIPRKPRTPKAKPVAVVVEAAPVEVKAEPVVAVVEKPEPKAEPKPKRRGGWKRRKSGNPITVSLVDCLGVGMYPTKKGNKAVAIHRRTPQGLEVLLWIDDNNETASHDDGGFVNSNGKLYGVEMF